MSREQERAILWYTCLAHALTHVYIHYFTPMVASMGADFGLDFEGLTRYATISTVLFGIGALPAGWLGDRFGEKRLLVAFFVLTAIGGATLGLAASRWQLAIGMAVLGIGTSIFHPVGNALIAKGIPETARAMGTNGLFGSLGTAASPALAALLATSIGWRNAYFVLVPPTLLLGLSLARRRLTPPSTTPPSTEEERAGPASIPASTPAAPTVPATVAPRGTERRSDLLTLLLILGATTCGGFNFHMIVTILPTHLSERLAGTWLGGEAAGGYLSGLIYTVGGVGQLLAGRAAHRREGRGVYVVILALAAPLIWSTGQGTAAAALIPIGCAMAIFVFAVQPVENVLLARFAPPRARGVVFGTKFVLSFGVGGLGTRVSGAVAARHGTGGVFTAAALTALGALAFASAAWWRSRRRGRSRSRPPRTIER